MFDEMAERTKQSDEFRGFILDALVERKMDGVAAIVAIAQALGRVIGACEISAEKKMTEQELQAVVEVVKVGRAFAHQAFHTMEAMNATH